MILLVGSSIEFHSLLKVQLNRWLAGDYLLTADSRRLALKINKDLQPKLVLIDISAPNHRDLSYVKDIKSDNSDTSVYVISTYDYPEYSETASSFGAEGLLHVGSESFIADLHHVVMTLPANAIGRCSYELFR